jgi:hypothetical protein
MRKYGLIAIMVFATLGLLTYALAENNTLGTDAGRSLTSGHSNTYLGEATGYDDTSGVGNTSVGYGAGYFNASGAGNVNIGYMAGYTNKSSYQLFIQHYRYPNYGIFGDFSTGKFYVGGTFRYNPSIVVSPRDTILTSNMSGKIIINTGAANGDSIFLPTCALGLNFTFMSTDADSMIIVAATGDSIFDASSLKPSKEGHAVNQSIEIIGVLTDGTQYNWLVKSKIGTWTGN